MRKFITLTLAGAAFAAAGVASAQPAQPAAVSNEVGRQTVPARAGQAFERLDRNRDGRLDGRDRQARQQAMFDRLDANHDGVINPAEFSAARAQRGTQIGERRQQLRQRFAQRGPGAQVRGQRGQGLRIQADSNRDGVITRDEFAAAALARFDRIDANRDGRVSPEERRGAFRGPRAG